MISGILEGLMKQFIALLLMGVLFFCCCPDLPADNKVNELIRGMTLEQKVGQLLFLGFQGREIQHKDTVHFQKIRPGGVVFYGRNFEDAAGIPPLVSKLHSIMGEDGLPLFWQSIKKGGSFTASGGIITGPPLLRQSGQPIRKNSPGMSVWRLAAPSGSWGSIST